MNIGETSRQSGVSERMIRHYEKIGLIPAPARRGAGYRDYGERDLHRLRFIANARDLGFPIEEIRTLLSLWANTGRASAEVKRLALARADEFQRKAEALTALRDTLIDLAERCQAQVEQCRRNTQGTRAGKYLILLGVGLGAKPDVLTTFCL